MPPHVLLTTGMAGSGKTTFLQRLNAHLLTQGKKTYTINLDPACERTAWRCNVDIRETVKIDEVMQEYGLGPNGAILTCLNLFTTKFDQVLDFIAKRAKDIDYVLIDTPGQIEIFTWSASGAIITEALSLVYPTSMVYIVDTTRCKQPTTFMANMLYACSILYKSNLPFLLTFNKTDQTPHQFAIDWMTDFEAFQDALNNIKDANDPYDEGGGGIMGSLNYSMSLVLEEFYAVLKATGVSSITGEGFRELEEKLAECEKEYNDVYKPDMLKQIEERKVKMQKETHVHSMNEKKKEEDGIEDMLAKLNVK